MNPRSGERFNGSPLPGPMPIDPQEPATKKEQIVALYLSGVESVEELALLTQSRPSYVGSVLAEAGVGPGYFDLYT